ncbi:MAG TPA: aspartate aminotransferase family protein [Beijerinckiaceae bacterium]|nr:aspartate aminotransferase family protein [Beijerinckiaceae bacterium]
MTKAGGEKKTESAVLPTYARADLRFERGEGSWLITDTGDRYLDCVGGVAVNALGHCHPHLVETLQKQAARLWHTSNLFRIPEGERLARRLADLTFADQMFFTNSGAEALECAIKMARKYHAVTGHPERYRIITFEGAFHGRTLATIAAGGNKKYLEGFGPEMPGFDQVPLNDIDAVKTRIGAETAGILVEPVQGEGGVRSATPAFLRELRQICDENGLLLIFDEVQCGMGRTGKLFAHEWPGIAPDIMAIAKAIGGGFPLGACLCTAEAGKGMTAGTHGSTYGGNPMAMAVGNAVLDVIAQDEFLAEVQRKALLFKQRLAELKDRYPRIIAEIRGEGLLLGLKAVVPNTDLVAAAREQHLLAAAAGENVMRLMPPLNITDQDIAEVLKRLDAACAALEGKARSAA